ncbi:hypothetical protein FYK55_02655 [Roseiconus nitratireducens]|uniref:Uncharacterized protein n=1 Tax=Roseiconus nitratireducens TaxID=2605748 RepID=A0A5M6DID0_9BACT|nr:hypothetical protein [Roseiconus nitratireducens]KAA5547314.1 hypothetical protein FYK55_02655 [Roseiconus nitratireducens]
MNSYNDLFVATVAFVCAGGSLAVSLGPWVAPYQLRSIAHIRQRFGESAARLTWLVVAIVSLLAGLAIAGGIRPGYAQPQPGTIQTAR